LQGPGGQVILINPEQVINIRRPRGIEQGHFAAGTQCLVFTTDGKYISLQESCERVRLKLSPAD